MCYLDAAKTTPHTLILALTFNVSHFSAFRDEEFSVSSVLASDVIHASRKRYTLYI